MAQQNMVQTNAAPQQNVNLSSAAQKNASSPKLKLSGGNAAQNQYMSYYNQIISQLGSSYTPTQVQHIESPGTLTAQQLEPYTPIEAEKIALEDRTYGDYAKEVESYLTPYLENAIAERRRQTANARKEVDVDLYGRGFGDSSYGGIAKLGLLNQEAADITAARNEFLGQVGQQAYSSMEAQRERNKQYSLYNTQAQAAVDQFNASMQQAADQWNKSAKTEADKWNLQTALDVALQNAGIDQFNSQMMTDWQQYLQQLAWGWAGQMQATNPVTRTVVKDPSGVENTESIWDKARGVLQGIGLGSSALGSAAQSQAASAADAVQAALAAAQAQASSLTPGSTYQSTKNKTSTVAGGTKVKQTK